MLIWLVLVVAVAKQVLEQEVMSVKVVEFQKALIWGFLPAQDYYSDETMLPPVVMWSE